METSRIIRFSVPDVHRPESEFGRELYELALDMTNPTHTGSVFSVQAELSIRAEFIARLLAECAWIQTGKQTNPDWNTFSLELQMRYRYLAERAVATIDPHVRLDAQAEAARATEDWMNGPYDPNNKPTYQNIADFAIGSYESILSGIRVARDGEK